MRTLLSVFLLPLLLYISPAAAQEWSPEQKEVVEFLNNYAKSSMQGDMDEIMSYFHADFSAREYSAALPEPLDLESTRQAIEHSNQNFKQLVFDVQALTIQFHGDVAIAHSNFKETMRDANGVDTKMSGPWTATLLKQGKGWVFTSWTWMYLEN